MITNLIEKELSAKKEDNTIVDKISKDSSSSRYWSGLNNPRVVRVSRSFGGKDRHSKVCTIKGLRDRRVRLSVPTAIQLYDLQHKLGLNQPSKVVDWLLNAAKDEIDELPPLQIPPGSFGQFPQSFISYEANRLQTSLASRVDGKIDYVKDVGSHSSPTVKDDRPKSTYWNRINSPLRSKCKEVAQETINEKRNWINRNEDENQGIEVQNAQVLSHNSLPRVGDSSFSGLLNSVMPQNSYYHWGHQNFPLSSLGNTGYSIQSDDPHNYNVISMPSPLSLPSASQLLFCPAPAPPSFFFPFVTSQVECNPRPINHLHMLSSTSQNLHTSSLNLTNYPPMRPLQYGINPSPRLLHSQNNNESQSNKGNGGPSSTFASTSFQNDPKAFCG